MTKTEEEEKVETGSVDGSASLTYPGSCPFDFLVCLDLTVNFEEDPTTKIPKPRNEAEIMRITFVVVSTEERLIVHSEQIFVQPLKDVPSETCFKMTGITAEEMESAVPLQSAIEKFDEFMDLYFRKTKKTFCIVTHTERDIHCVLPREAKDKHLSIPSYFESYFNVVEEANIWLSLNQLTGKKVRGRQGLIMLCQDLGIEAKKGVDDAFNVGEIVMRLLEKIHSRKVDADTPKKLLPLTIPIDTNDRMEAFSSTKSKVVRFLDIPARLTQSEMEDFLARSTLQATALWSIKSTDGKSDGTAFAMFATHEQAAACLELNDKTLLDQLVQVLPSSEVELGELEHLKIAFAPARTAYAAPPSGPTTDFRDPYRRDDRRYDTGGGGHPGDWTCENCSFRNYASRTKCGVCHIPNPDPSAEAALQKGAPGDWPCPNPSCRFLNFYSRSECMRCNTPKPFIGDDNITRANRAATGRARVPKTRATDRPGDWNCENPDCRYHNYSSRTECYRCKAPKTAAQAAASQAAAMSGRGRGGYESGGDWNCSNPSCGHHNMSYQDRCGSCGSGKPGSGQSTPGYPYGGSPSVGYQHPQPTASSYSSYYAAYGQQPAVTQASGAYGAQAYGQQQMTGAQAAQWSAYYAAQAQQQAAQKK